MPREDNDPTVMGLIVQLLEENRTDLKEVRREVHDGFVDLRARVSRLEAGQAAQAAKPQSAPPVATTWTPAVKAGTAGAGLVALLPVVLYVLQTFGVLPPPAPGTPPPPLPTLSP